MFKKKMYITQSEVGEFTRCRYKWYLSYVQLVTAKKTPHYFEDGSIFHNGLENLGNGMSMKDIAIQIRKDYENLVTDSKVPVTQEMVDDYDKRCQTIQGMVSGYEKLYGKEYADDWELINAEEEFCVKFFELDGWEFYQMGKKDKKIRLKIDGKPYLVEHKSASQISASYINKLPRDQQTLTYSWADSKDYPDDPAIGVIYDVVKKPSIRQKKTETRQEFLKRIEALYIDSPEKYFFRETLRYNQKRLDKFEKNLKILATHMKECIEDPKKNVYKSYGACDDFGGCQYKDICNRNSLKGPHMAGFFKRPSKHQELDRQDETKGKEK